MRTPKYPAIEVKLIGQDGNAFAVLGAVRRALRDNGVEAPEVEAFTAEAMAVPQLNRPKKGEID